MFGTVGRSDSATDNAPLDMYDTTIMLKPREQWRAGMTYEKLIQEMDEKLQFPGLSNTWTMPVENRLDMELTGHQDAGRHEGAGAESRRHPAVGDASAAISRRAAARCGRSLPRRVSQGFYVNVEVNRPEAARYGLTVADVQQAVTSGIGGKNIAENIEGTRALSDQCPISAATSATMSTHCVAC